MGKSKQTQAIYSMLSAITTTWSKTIVIAGDTNIDYNKPSTVLETNKEVLDTYTQKSTQKSQLIKVNTQKSQLIKVSKPQITLLGISKLKKSS